ncbi:hypothetical protein MLD38_031821 [Melastoma candidum]|uniref:Uncharacterized protein n=1 Tax=Melastoma candidum TaxID=119954 RepID=A0ACB9MST6_9MYRT|nr:hypothetical protein MLD38_031821 [Melastoma candidum]
MSRPDALLDAAENEPSAMTFLLTLAFLFSVEHGQSTHYSGISSTGLKGVAIADVPLCTCLCHRADYGLIAKSSHFLRLYPFREDVFFKHLSLPSRSILWEFPLPSESYFSLTLSLRRGNASSYISKNSPFHYFGFASKSSLFTIFFTLFAIIGLSVIASSTVPPACSSYSFDCYIDNQHPSHANLSFSSPGDSSSSPLSRTFCHFLYILQPATIKGVGVVISILLSF